MAAVANLRPVKDDAPPVPVRTGSASLGHIKEKRADGREPWDEVPAEPVKRRRIAWPGGKITSNKDEALVAYLSKKLERGEALTDVQRAAFDKATRGTRFEGKSEAEAMEFAAAERKTLPAAAPTCQPCGPAEDLHSARKALRKHEAAVMDEIA